MFTELTTGAFIKIKLESQENLTVLVVSETLQPSELPILRAGLAKLFQSGHKVVLLDLIAVPQQDLRTPEAIASIAGCRIFASEQGAQLVIASPVNGIGDVALRSEAVQQMNSPLGRLLALEKRLIAQIRKVEEHKSLLDGKMKTVEQTSGQVLNLRRENFELKRRLNELEKQVRHRFEARSLSYANELNRAKYEAAVRVLVSVMEQEGVLPVI